MTHEQLERLAIEGLKYKEDVHYEGFGDEVSGFYKLIIKESFGDIILSTRHRMRRKWFKNEKLIFLHISVNRCYENGWDGRFKTLYEGEGTPHMMVHELARYPQILLTLTKHIEELTKKKNKIETKVELPVYRELHG